MLYQDKIDFFEGTDVNKTSQSKEHDTFHYWCFLHKMLKFQSDACNGCHDVIMMSMNRSEISILKIHDADYCWITSKISKSEAIKVMENIELT